MTTDSYRPGIQVLPTTQAGRWSVALFGISIACWVVFLGVVDAGARGEDARLIVAVVAAFASALAGASAALAAELRNGERGLGVLGPILWGVASAVFLTGQFMGPK